MRLIDRLVGRRQPERMSWGDYVEMLNSYSVGFGLGQPYGGLQQTLVQESVETPAATLESYARNAFAANGVVFACMMVRQLVFSSVRFQWQRVRDGSASSTFGTAELSLLERPWKGGTTQDLLSRMIQDADLHGNSYWVREGAGRVSDGVAGESLVRLRPDWVQVIGRKRVMSKPGQRGAGQVGWQKIGYLYTEGGIGNGEPVAFTVDEVAHFAPIPDPLAAFTGMSWLTPILREIAADQSMTTHQKNFMTNGATPNMIIKHPLGADRTAILKWAQELQSSHGGSENAGKTLNLYPGADATVVGSNFKDADFKNIRGGGETRIAAAAGVPPVIVGLSEGLAAATYCLPGDEQVWTLEGPRSIEKVRSGDLVWSHVDGGLAPRRVTWQGQVGTKAVYTLRTKNRVLRATGNHPVLVRRPGSLGGGSNDERRVGVRWMNVEDLQVGDRVVQVEQLPDLGGDTLPTGVTATADMLQWLGAYTGDGSGIGHERGAISLAIPPTDRAHSHYLKLTDELFRPTTLSVQDKQFRFHSKAVKEQLRPLGVHGTASTKRVPGWVFGLRRDLRLAYLAGLVDTDGSIDKRGTLKFQFANRWLVEDVKALMVGCGVQVSNLYHQTYTADVLPQAGSNDEYEAWAVVASSADEVAAIPFADELYRERVEQNTGRRRRGGLDAWKAGIDPTSLGFYTIRSIEKGAPEPVYDITVDGGHSFVASGVVVHNSNYGQARRRLADGTAHPLWENLAGSLEVILRLPEEHGVRLWYDADNVPFLREDEKDAAEIAATKAQTVNSYITAGYDPDSVVNAVMANDMRLLKHSGFYSVQLQALGDKQGTGPAPVESQEDQ